MALSSADASPGTYWVVSDRVMGVRPPQEQHVDAMPTPGIPLPGPRFLTHLQVFARGVLSEAGPEGGSVQASLPTLEAGWCLAGLGPRVCGVCTGQRAGAASSLTDAGAPPEGSSAIQRGRMGKADGCTVVDRLWPQAQGS